MTEESNENPVQRDDRTDVHDNPPEWIMAAGRWVTSYLDRRIDPGKSIELWLIGALLMVSIVGQCVAIRNADTAREAVTATREQMRLEQRAWIGVTGARIDNPPITRDKIASIHVVVNNTGRTPGLNIHLQLATVLRPYYPLEDDYVIPVEITETQTSSVILPDSEFTVPMSQSRTINDSIAAQIPEPLATEIVEGRLRAELYQYFIGILTYEDIFGIAHVSRFCLHWTELMEQNTLTTCRTWNEMN